MSNSVALDASRCCSWAIPPTWRVLAVAVSTIVSAWLEGYPLRIWLVSLIRAVSAVRSYLSFCDTLDLGGF